MAVLTHGGFGVAVDVEGVRDLRPAPVAVPHPQPHRGLRPGRRSGGGFGLADLESDKCKRRQPSPYEKMRGLVSIDGNCRAA